METLKEILSASNPGLITRDDLRRIEERLDDLEDIVAELEERLNKETSPPPRRR